MKQRATLIFLILLRFAIGWHFFFEAVEKQRTVNIGPSEISRPWTSENYFREAQGPMGSLMRKKLGDVDDVALARLALRPGAEPDQRLPVALLEDWHSYAEQFAKHYKLAPDQQDKLRAALAQEKEKTLTWFTCRVGSVPWLLSGQWADLDRKPFKRTYPTGAIEVNLTIEERAEEYRRKVAEYRSVLNEKPEAMGRDVEKSRRPGVRAEVISLRSELAGALDRRTAEMKSTLAEVLTDEQLKLGPVPESKGWRFIDWVDRATIWGLMAIGIGLMLGLFSRTAALGGALFLVMTILTTPALPWLPAPPNAEGNYVFISKNVIEMLALFMLACVPTGRWFGVDALIKAVIWRNSPDDE